MRIPGPVNALKLRRKVHVRPMNWQEHTAEEHVIFAIEQKVRFILNISPYLRLQRYLCSTKYGNTKKASC